MRPARRPELTTATSTATIARLISEPIARRQIVFKSAVITAALGMLFGAAFLVYRRMAGGLQQSLQDGSFIAVSCCLVATVEFARRQIWQHYGSPSVRYRSISYLVASEFVLLAVCVALTTLQLTSITIFSIWLLVVCESAAIGYTAWRLGGGLPSAALREARWFRRIDRALLSSAQCSDDQVTRSTSTSRSFAWLAHAEAPNGLITQHLRRVCLPSGGEEVTGTIAATLSAGERNHVFHVAFCPPLNSTPQMTVEQVQGPSAVIKLADVRTYGTRIDVRLDAAASDEVIVEIQFSARSPNDQEPDQNLP